MAQIGSCLLEGTRLGVSHFALDRDARLAITTRKESLAINPVDGPAIWGESGVSMMIPCPTRRIKLVAILNFNPAVRTFHGEQ